MNKLIIITTLFLSYFSVKGQYQSIIKLAIDTDCYCNDSSIENLKGKFGIYAYSVGVPRNSNNYVDTLIRELDYKKEQTIALEQGNYILKYTPSDSIENTNQYYFSALPYNYPIHLNCFFFNRRYPPMISQLIKGESIVFTSKYIGTTTGETLIPTHTVVIFKRRGKYYASYYKIEQIETNIMVPNYTFQKPLFEPQLLLTEKQIQQIEEFEGTLSKLSINDNLKYEATSINSITLNGKRISFHSKGYVSLLLWDELNKTIKNWKNE